MELREQDREHLEWSANGSQGTGAHTYSHILLYTKGSLEAPICLHCMYADSGRSRNLKRKPRKHRKNMQSHTDRTGSNLFKYFFENVSL